MQQKRTFSHEDVGSYTVTKSPRARRITLRIASNGMPNVTIPRNAPFIIGRRFLESHTDWVKEHHIPAHQWQASQSYSLYDSTTVTIELAPRNTKQITTGLIDLRITDNEAGQSYANKVIKDFLTTDTELQIRHLLSQLQNEMVLTPKGVRVRATTSRWGSCSSKGFLTFSSYLAQLPKDLIRYVIVHELAHLAHLNHSPKFWALVEQYDPNFKDHRKRLKSYSLQPEITKN